jgi:cell division septation protein DedD
MIKLVITLLNLMVILALQVFPGNVSVKMDVPTEVRAGSEFEVKVTLNKGNLQGFSRFQQSIPAGLTASSGSSSNADFSFSDKRVRLIWLRIPDNDEITVNYHVKVDERLKGTFMLAGKFSYIDNNERKSIDIQPVAINIQPSATIDPSLIVDVNDFEKMTMPYPGLTPNEAVSVACIRQTPYPGIQGDYIVNVLVSENLTRQFAKIEENVPEGYTAVALDTKDAIFTFKEQKVKFLWMNLPTEPYFTVSYRLIPKNQAKLPAPVINGAFSYLVEENSVSVDIIQRDLNLADLNGENVNALVAKALAEPSPVIAQIPVEEPVKVEPQAQTEPEVKSVDKPEGRPEKVTKPSRQKPATSTVTADASSLLDPEQGIYYRIQLAAGHKPINTNRYFTKMNLEKEVRQESHEGWKKYSIGSFGLYKEARDYRVHIWNTTPVKDAFITAYNSGQRITVQEALMITEQKWYR